MQASNPKTNPAPAAIMLGGGAIALASFPGANVIGALMVMSSAWRMIEAKQTPIEAVEALVKEVWGGFADCFSGPAEQGLSLSREIVTNAGDQMPWAQYLELKAVEELNHDTGWLKPIVEMDAATKRVRHFGVCGEPGDGKTLLLLMTVNAFLTKYPTGKVLIHDLDFDNNHNPDAGQPAWYGLELGKQVFTEVSDIDIFADVIEDEFTARTGQHQHPPMLIVIDEFNNLMGELSEKSREAFISLLGKVKNRGGKRGMQLAIATQRLEVGELKINQAFISSLDWIVLRGASAKRWVTKNLGMIDEPLADFRAAARKIQRMGKVDGVRPCVAYMGGEVDLKAVPGADTLPDTVELVSPKSKGQQWIESLFQAYPEILDATEANEFENLKALTMDGNFKTIVKAFDGSIIQRKTSDFRYVALRDWWDSLEAEKLPPENPAPDAPADV
ncbi:MAG: hypothetical protein AAFV72_00095 [Cyanobacteria bacterium J06635_1]